ncbi:hypothetical protein DIPPA_16068 [Diplonema papillatum]|nr:hypothetical protein DIPPA_16068 [Diplonema papillatum]
MPIRVSITMVIVATMFLSSVASIGGGVILYFDSLSALKERVRQLSMSDTYSVVTSLSAQIHETMDTTEDLTRQIRMHGGLLQTTEGNRLWTRAAAYGAVRSRRSFYSAGLTAYPVNVSNFENSDDFLYEVAWGDVLADGSPQYVAGTSNVTMAEDCAPYPPDTELPRCVHAYTLKDDGSYDQFLYSYPTTTAKWVADRAEEFRGRVGNGSRLWVDFWMGPYTWTSSDGFRYMYAGLYRVFNEGALPSNPFFRDKRVAVQTFIQFDSWSDILESHSTDATMAVYYYNGSVSESILLATNNKELVQNCSLESVDRRLTLVCASVVGDQRNDVAAALRAIATERTYRTFTRVSASGGDVWAFAACVASEITDYTGGEYVLLWVLPVSSVEAELRASLISGIVFMGCILLVVYGIGLLQIRLLASPLRNLARATEALQMVDLDKTEACTARADRGMLKMNEVVAVTDGIRFVVRSLRIVKMFIPQYYYAMIDNRNAAGAIRMPESETWEPRSEPAPCVPPSPDETSSFNRHIKATAIQPFASDGGSNQSIQAPDVTEVEVFHPSSPSLSPLRVVNPLATKSQSSAYPTPGVTISGRALNTLATVKATVLTFRLRETDDFSTFEMILSQFEHAASGADGMLHPLSATSPYQLTITWNTSTPCVGGVSRACTVSRGLSNQLSRHLLSCAISHGTCTAGFVGTRNTLGFAICGAPVDLSEALLLSSAEYTQLLRTSAPVVAICAATQSSVRGTFNVVPIDLVSVKGLFSIVWMLGCRIDERNVEWMYHTHSSQHSLEPLFAKLVKGASSLLPTEPSFVAPKDDETAGIIVKRLKDRYPAIFGSVSQQLVRRACADEWEAGMSVSTT